MLIIQLNGKQSRKVVKGSSCAEMLLSFCVNLGDFPGWTGLIKSDTRAAFNLIPANVRPSIMQSQPLHPFLNPFLNPSCGRATELDV